MNPTRILLSAVLVFAMVSCQGSGDKAQNGSGDSAQGEFAHDQRLALVDGDANIRGYYDVLNVQRGDIEYQRLVRDLKMVLNPELKLSDLE